MNKRNLSLLTIVLFTVIFAGCASKTQVSEQQQQQQDTAGEISDPRDPLEGFNRTMWTFNKEYLDEYIVRPATVAYVTVMPQFARTGLLNAAENLQEPAFMLNNMLQGKFSDGLDSLARFAINSTVGLLGTIDVAGAMGLERQDESFGETLGVWGANTGPYLMIPAYGPNEVRGLSGDVVDGMVYPMSILNTPLTILRFAVNGLEKRAALIDQEGQLEQAIDDYAFVKEAYFQNLEFKVTDGENLNQAVDEEELENFEDFESMLEELDESQ